MKKCGKEEFVDVVRYFDLERDIGLYFILLFEVLRSKFNFLFMIGRGFFIELYLN